MQAGHGGCVDGGSVGGGCGSLFGGPGDGAPASSIPARTPGLVCQSQSTKTPSTNVVLLKGGVGYLKDTQD